MVGFPTPSPAMSTGATKGQRLIPFKVSTVGMYLVDCGTEHAKAVRNLRGILRVSPTIRFSQNRHYLLSFPRRPGPLRLGAPDKHVLMMRRMVPTRKLTRPMARPRTQIRVSVMSGGRIGT